MQNDTGWQGLYVDRNGDTPTSGVVMSRVGDGVPNRELMSCEPGEEEMHFHLADGRRVPVSAVVDAAARILELETLAPQGKFEEIPTSAGPSDREQMVIGNKRLAEEIQVLQETLQQMSDRAFRVHGNSSAEWDLPDVSLEEAIDLHNKSEDEIERLQVESRMMVLQAKRVNLIYQIKQLELQDHAERLRRAVRNVPRTPT